MVNNELEIDLADYFDEKNKFTEVRSYFGMSASQKGAVFTKYFDSLSVEKQKETAFLLALVVCGKHSKFFSNLPNAVNLVMRLCLSGYSSCFQGSLTTLEEEFNSNDNVKTWLKAGDNLDVIGGLDWKKTWRYALSLYNILKLINSEKTKATVDILQSTAFSDEFKRNLK